MLGHQEKVLLPRSKWNLLFTMLRKRRQKDTIQSAQREEEERGRIEDHVMVCAAGKTTDARSDHTPFHQ